MKKSLIFILALTLGVGTMQAENGTCGENLTWNLKGKVLTIQGEGAMPDFAQGTTPWNEAQETIMTVVVKDGVTSIGENAFANCKKMQEINYPNGLDMTKIGAPQGTRVVLYEVAQ